MNREAWHAVVHGVAKSWTWLSNWSELNWWQYLSFNWCISMAPHSSTLAWQIPWREEPGRLQSMGSLGVGHDWATWLSLFTFMHWRRKWQPTSVFLPGESQGRGSLVGCRLWGHTESDTTEETWQQTINIHDDYWYSWIMATIFVSVCYLLPLFFMAIFSIIFLPFVILNVACFNLMLYDSTFSLSVDFF